MNLFFIGKQLAVAALLCGPTLASASESAAAPAVDKVFLAPHRAVYDLKLLNAHGNRSIDSVDGRIVYDFSGNACQGYSVKFRQVSDLQSDGGRSVLSDLRSTTWEDKIARKFRFSSENLINEQRTITVDGHAERTSRAVTVSLRKPQAMTFKAPAGTVFPTDHIRRIIVAARKGKSILHFPVYDGSDNGRKIYNTLTVIGKPILPGGKSDSDATAKFSALAKLTRWPVTISYFEKESARKQQGGEQTPVYAITFELYENGISRTLILDYRDFTLIGKMTSLDLKKPKPCR